MSAVPDLRPFREARDLTHGLSSLLHGRDLSVTYRALERAAEALEAVASSPDELVRKLQFEDLSALGELMDGLSLDLAAIRMNVREGPRLFRLRYWFSIRHFDRVATRIAVATDIVRSHLPQCDQPSSEELADDARDLAESMAEKDDWVSFGDILEEDRERWQRTE